LKRAPEKDKTAKPLSTLLMRVDRFKELTIPWDTPVGDRLLREICRASRKIQRRAGARSRDFEADDFALLIANQGCEGGCSRILLQDVINSLKTPLFLTLHDFM